MGHLIEEIKSKFEVLKSLDTEFEVFGASAHQYLLNPTLNEKEISQFEKKHHLKFPPSYRDFLMEIGNGGAGPSYGVFPMGFMDYGFDLQEWANVDYIYPTRTFRFLNSFNDTSILYRGAPQEPDFQSHAEYQVEYRLWEDAYASELELEYWLAHSLDGAIPVCHRGCALSTWLVVAEGKEYGHIWHDDTVDKLGVYPDVGTHPGPINKQSRVQFEQWYLNWLNKSISWLNGKKP